MNIFSKVTLESLKKNKTRTIVTIIGVMLSAAMICAVTTSIASLSNFLLQNTIHEKGDWHGQSMNVDAAALARVSSSVEVEKLTWYQHLGYALAEGSQNEYKPYLYVIGAGDGFADMMPVHLIAGSYPVSSDELLLPSHLADNGGVVHKLGDLLTLALGERMSKGQALGQSDPYTAYEVKGKGFRSDEEIVVRETRTYTVVGFYGRPDFEDYAAPGYTALTLADKNPGAESLYDVFFKMVKPQATYAFMADNNLGTATNSDVLMFSGAARYANYYRVLYSLAAIVIGLIMFGSISLIYNAFAISVSERTQLFGLLSSIGATKKQLRKSVLFEAFVVSAIGIPLGILLGVGGIGTTLLIIGDKFSSLGGFDIPMRIRVSPASIVVACAVALATVLVSAWIPSKRAARVSAVEAIRQNADIAARATQVRSSRLMYRLFGLPGMLAGKYFERSRKKYRATIVSLFMSIVLFISASAFTAYLTDSVEGGFSTYGYDLVYSSNNDPADKASRDELLAQLGGAADIEKSAYTQTQVYPAKIAGAYLTAAYKNNQVKAQQETRIAKYADTVSGDAIVSVIFVDDASFRELLAENKLSQQDFMNPDSPKAIAIDGNTAFDYVQEKFVTRNVLDADACQITVMKVREMDGYVSYDEWTYDQNKNRIFIYTNPDDPQDQLKVPESEAMEEITLNTGKVLYTKPFYLSETGELTLVYPYSLRWVTGGEPGAADTNLQFYFTSANHKASFDAIKAILTEKGLSSEGLFDYAQYADQSRNTVTIINVFAYGFIVLISLIAAANVFNTVSTNISLRRREFAMLKSVGMTRGGFNRMMNYECLLYGTRALLYGLPVSAAITFFIYQSVDTGYTSVFSLPWKAVGIAVLSVFAIVFATMMYAMRKIKNDNPIDALKNENL